MDCAFPSSNGWSKTVFDYHCYTIVLSLSLAWYMITDAHLERFYYPLAISAKLSVVFQIAESIIYLLILPPEFQNVEAIHNCGEIVLSRLHAIFTLFGEMHFVYFLAKALGLGGNNISILRNVKLTLSQGLTLVLFAAVATVLACIFYRRTFGLVRNAWCICLALLQYQQIRTAKAKQDSEDCLIRPNDASVRTFEKLTLMQVFIGAVCLLQRMVYKPLYPDGIVRYNNARLVLDYATVLLFYMKVLLVQEKANVELILD
jgi:hypothetical protein